MNHLAALCGTLLSELKIEMSIKGNMMYKHYFAELVAVSKSKHAQTRTRVIKQNNMLHRIFFTAKFSSCDSTCSLFPCADRCASTAHVPPEVAVSPEPETAVAMTTTITAAPAGSAATTGAGEVSSSVAMVKSQGDLTLVDSTF